MPYLVSEFKRVLQFRSGFRNLDSLLSALWISTPLGVITPRGIPRTVESVLERGIFAFCVGVLIYLILRHFFCTRDTTDQTNLITAGLSNPARRSRPQGHAVMSASGILDHRIHCLSICLAVSLLTVNLLTPMFELFTRGAPAMWDGYSGEAIFFVVCVAVRYLGHYIIHRLR